MAILNQNSQSQTFFAGWYGTCEAECQNLNISTSSFRDKIYKIYQIRDNNLTYDVFDGVVPQNLDDTVQIFTEFECGKYYIIILKSGTGQVDLPDFKEVNNGSLDAGRVTQSCEPTYELIDLLGYDGNLNETDFNSPVIQLQTNRVGAGTPVPFTIHGSNITLEDFVGLNSLQGTFIVGSNGSNGNYLLSNLNLKIAEDSTTEGPETFRISLDNHPDVYLDMTILDTSHQPHTYLLEEADGYVSVSENSPSNITTINLITTELVGSIIPFNLSGSGITIEDFTGTIPVDSSLQGNFQITDTISSGDNAGKNLGQVTFEIAEDSTTEGPETFTIVLSDHPEVFLDMTILDTSTSPPTYTLSSTESADEGSVVTLTLETTGVDTGTPVPFTIHGSNITLEDFVGLNSLGAGEFIIDSNGDATFPLEINADSTNEGPEIFTVTLDDHPSVSVDVTINDTSTSTPTYTLSSNLDSVEEGSVVTLTLKTTLVDAGTSVPFTIHGSNITLEDFIGLPSLGAGAFIIDSNGDAIFQLEINADSTTEGPEIFTVTLDDHPDIFVDVLIISQTWDLTASPLQVTGDDTVELSLSTSNVEDGSYSFNITGLSEGDIDESNGSVFWNGKNYAGFFDLVNNVSSPLTLNILNNNLSNVVMTAELDNKQDFEDVNINNVIIPPFIPEYYLSITPETFGYGDTVEVKLFTNLPENSIVPYTITGEVELSDFDPPLSSKTGHNFTVGPYGIAKQQYTFTDGGTSDPNYVTIGVSSHSSTTLSQNDQGDISLSSSETSSETSKTFGVILDNVTPLVYDYAILKINENENPISDAVKIHSGIGGTGIKDVTHEGYGYKWSDITLRQSGQYFWRIGLPLHYLNRRDDGRFISDPYGLLSPDKFVDVKINGQSVDFSKLSGHFEISSPQENFEFEIYIRNDQSDGRYIDETDGQEFSHFHKDLRLTITYVPDGSYDFDDIKIFPQPKNKINSYSHYEGHRSGSIWNWNNLGPGIQRGSGYYYNYAEKRNRRVTMPALSPEGILTNEVWQSDYRWIQFWLSSNRVPQYHLGLYNPLNVHTMPYGFPYPTNYLDLLNDQWDREIRVTNPEYNGGFNPTYTFMLEYNRLSEIALRGGDPNAENLELESGNLEDEIYFEITQSTLVDNNHYSFIDLNSIEYIKTWNQYWFFGSSEYNTGLSEYKSNDPHYLPIQLDANGNITGFFAKNLWRKPDPSYGQWNGIGNGYAKSYVQIKFKDEYVPLLYGKQFRFRLKHPHPQAQLDSEGAPQKTWNHPDWYWRDVVNARDDRTLDASYGGHSDVSGFHQHDFIFDHFYGSAGFVTEANVDWDLFLTPTHTDLEEGDGFYFTEIMLTAEDDYPVLLGKYKFQVFGEGITPDDFLGWSTIEDEYNYTRFDHTMEGIITVTANSIPSIIIATRADFRTEGTEQFFVKLVDFPNVSTAQTININIDDTSQSGPLTLTAQFPSPPIDENGHTKILLNYDSKNLTQYDRFAFRITGEGITPDDFEYWVTTGTGEQSFGTSLEGFMEVNDVGYGFVEIKMREDSKTEQAEVFTVELIDYPEVTVQVTVNDTSQGTS